MIEIKLKTFEESSEELYVDGTLLVKDTVLNIDVILDKIADYFDFDFHHSVYVKEEEEIIV